MILVFIPGRGLGGGLSAQTAARVAEYLRSCRFGIDGICHGASWAAEELPPDRTEAYLHAIERDGPMRARLEWLA